MFEITKEFVFDAAHFLPHAPAGHPHARMHGHSFYVEVTLRGEAHAQHGWVKDFAEIDRVLAALREDLDHHLLNELEGLGVPTLENLSRYIFNRLAPQLKGISRVTVRRPSHRESCTYFGDE